MAKLLNGVVSGFEKLPTEDYDMCGNIRIREENGKEIYLYSHWGGCALPLVLKRALMRGKSRWSDESYLTRIIFCEMVKGDEMNETGFGISTSLTDNEHLIIEVNMKEQMVFFLPEKAPQPKPPYHNSVGVITDRRGCWTFEEYIDTADEILKAGFEGGRND